MERRGSIDGQTDRRHTSVAVPPVGASYFNRAIESITIDICSEIIYASCLISCSHYFKDAALTHSTGVGRHGHGRFARLLWTWRHFCFHRSFQRVWGFTRRWIVRWQDQGRVSFMLAGNGIAMGSSVLEATRSKHRTVRFSLESQNTCKRSSFCISTLLNPFHLHVVLCKFQL